MAVAVRLMRLGKKNKPFYRIVAVDKRKKRNSRYIEVIGLYDPISNPSNIQINWEKLESWKQKGAIISEGMHKLLKAVKNTAKKDSSS